MPSWPHSNIFIGSFTSFVLLSAWSHAATGASTQTVTDQAEMKIATKVDVDTSTVTQRATSIATATATAASSTTSAADAGKSPTQVTVAPVKQESLIDKIDAHFGTVVHWMASVLFVEIISFDKRSDGKTLPVGVPLIVLVLVCGAVFYTIYHRFLNIRGFKHAIDVTRGIYDNPDDPGEISHFQALTSALSATVGLGNIAGVAIAVTTGGPGAVFWMIVLGLFGMSSKFHECTLAQLYRSVDKDGVVHGGPMYYLDLGLRERGLPGWLAKTFGVVFAVFCIGGSFGGGNMFQANQAWGITKDTLVNRFGLELGAWSGLVFGLILAFLVGLVIVGGIKRIGTVTEKIIPLMCGIYLMAGFVILFGHIGDLPGAIGLIFSEAFSFQAGFGGFVGVAVQGVKRAVFSNEAGIGSAAIAHSAAKTDEPVREGVVALLGPFIDTVVICTMTALVVIVTGAYNNPAAGEGVSMTAWAFGSQISWFPLILALSVFLFAYSTMISWSYYGEKCFAYLFGREVWVSLIYKFIFLVAVVVGSVASLENVIEFSDLMILSMAFPNIIGGLLLAPKVREHLESYWKRLEAGEFKIYK
jgi:alanine or glycine:cation symporter, AGCS family